MKTITYSALRANLAENMKRVCEDHEPYIVTREKSDSVVLLSLEDYQAMEETCYLLKTPRNASRLGAAIDEIEAEIARKSGKKKKK